MTIERTSSQRMRWTTLLGLVLVPVLVAGGLLWASWNSDERLHAVQAAVVNLDEAVTIDGEYVPLGRQLTAALVDSDRVENLSWVLDDSDGARQGLASGRYAAAVTIPKEFSEAATSYAGDAADATRATIRVETSPVAGIADATLGKVVAHAAATTLNETLTSTYLDQIYLGFNEMGDQFVTMADGAGELADGAEQLADGIEEAADGSVQLVDGTSELADGLGTMSSETASLPADTRKLANGTKELASGVKRYVGGVNDLVDQTIDSLGQQAELVSGVGQLSQGASGISGGLQAYRQQMQGLGENSQVLTPATSAAQQAAAQAAQQVTCPTFSEDEATQQMMCTAFTAGRDAGTQVGAQVGAQVGVAAGGQAAAAGLSQADPQTGQSLLSGAQALDGGLSELLQELQDAGGEGNPTAQLKQLKAAGKKLASGTADLADGTDQLADGIPQLTDGIARSADGAAQLADGMAEFSDGLADAADGSRELADGARGLADGIAEGSDKLPSYTDSERTNLAEVVATPIATENLEGTAGVGVGWATLLLVLSLWLGALATYLVVKPLSARLLGSARSSVHLIAEALLPGIVVVGIQTVVVTGIGQVALQLSLPKLAAVTGIMLLAGLTFVVLNHALAAWLGNLGRLVGITLAVLGGASAITSAAPAVFDALRAFSPITPALDAIRAVITESSGAATNTYLLVGWLVVGLAASAIAVVRSRTTTFAALLQAHGVPA